jgi:predicted AAA+ superfamily ATPase
MEVLSLWPLSSAELADHAAINRADALFAGDWAALNISPCEKDALVARLTSGGFPEAAQRSSAARREAWFQSYVQAILQRDVRELAHIEQLTEIPNLLQLLATRSAALLNLAELSRTARLSQTTLKRYFALLEMLFLVVRVPAWARNAGKRLVKAPKVFLPDTGLLSYFLGDTAQGLAAQPGLPGGTVETFVLTELLKHLAFSQQRLSLWHYRTQTDIEVDFILENRLGQMTGIEVKASATVDGKDFRGLRHLQATEGPIFQRGIVLYAGRELLPFGDNLWAVAAVAVVGWAVRSASGVQIATLTMMATNAGDCSNSLSQACRFSHGCRANHAGSVCAHWRTKGANGRIGQAPAWAAQEALMGQPLFQIRKVSAALVPCAGAAGHAEAAGGTCSGQAAA